MINLRDQPDWFTEKNQAGEVPVLEWIDEKTKEVRIIPESLVVCDYLEALHPEPRLHPTDPYERARQSVLVGRYGNVRNLKRISVIRLFTIDGFVFRVGSIFILFFHLWRWKRCC